MRHVRIIILMLSSLILSACGIGLIDLDRQRSQLTEAQIRQTVEAELRATMAAQQTGSNTTAAAPAEPTATPASEPTATPLAEPTATPAGTASGAEGATTSATAVTGATEAVPTPVASNPETGDCPVSPSSDSTIAGALPGGAEPVATQTTKAPPALLLILDSSGSMLADDGTGRRKIDTAKAAMRQMVDQLPEGVAVGLRVYGHRVPNTDKANGCNDTELIVPVGPLDREAMKAKIDAFQATGWTPIATSLDQAANDLPPEGERTIILVSDGEETCDRDPCEAARNLLAKGINVKIHTIGFQVNQTARSQLECIAKATGGEYRDVQNAADLASTIVEFTTRAFRPYETAGTPVRGGDSFSNAPVLSIGQYQDTIKLGETRYYAVDLKRGQQLRASVTVVGQPDRFNVIGSMGNSVTLRVHDPLRRAVASDFIVNFGQQTESVALEMQPAPEDGRYYLSLEGVATYQGVIGHEFKTELLIDVVSGSGESCLVLTGVFASQTPVPPGPVQGGGSFNTAPLIQSGLYSDTIQLGETLYYAINLQAGQRLRVSSTIFGEPIRSRLTRSSLLPQLRIYDPLRREGAQDSPTAREGDMSMGLETEPVQRGGRYYLSLELLSHTRDTQPQELETELQVEVIGP